MEASLDKTLNLSNTYIEPFLSRLWHWHSNTNKARQWLFHYLCFCRIAFCTHCRQMCFMHFDCWTQDGIIGAESWSAVIHLQYLLLGILNCTEKTDGYDNHDKKRKSTKVKINLIKIKWNTLQSNNIYDIWIYDNKGFKANPATCTCRAL